MLRTLEMHHIPGTPADRRNKEQLWCAALLPPEVGVLVIDVQTIGHIGAYVQSVVCPASLEDMTLFSRTDAVVCGMYCVPVVRRDGSGRDTPFAIGAVASGTLPSVEGGPILLLRDLEGNWLFRGLPVETNHIHELTLFLEVVPENERYSPVSRFADASPGAASKVGARRRIAQV